MAAPWKWSQPFFSFGCESYKQSGCKTQSQTATPIKHKIPHLELENIHEPILDFTAYFSEINPDISYCTGLWSGLQGSLQGSSRVRLCHDDCPFLLPVHYSADSLTVVPIFRPCRITALLPSTFRRLAPWIPQNQMNCSQLKCVCKVNHFFFLYLIHFRLQSQ